MKKLFALMLLICLVVFALPGCGGEGTQASPFAGKWSGTYSDAFDPLKSGPISAAVAVDGTVQLAVDGVAHVGYVTPSGLVGGIPPIGGSFSIDGNDLGFRLTRGKDALVGKMSRNLSAQRHGQWTAALRPQSAARNL